MTQNSQMNRKLGPFWGLGVGGMKEIVEEGDNK